MHLGNKLSHSLPLTIESRPTTACHLRLLECTAGDKGPSQGGHALDFCALSCPNMEKADMLSFFEHSHAQIWKVLLSASTVHSATRYRKKNRSVDDVSLFP